MKKVISFLLAAVMLLSLAACGGKEKTENNDAAIQVDEGLLTMEVTLAASFFEDRTDEDIIADSKEQGFLDCTINEDGSVTYTMTKLKHQEKLKEFRDGLAETVNSLLEGENKVASFLSIDYNDDFSKIDIYVDPATYTSWDNLYALAFYISGAYYQSFAGVESDKIDVVVNFIDNTTKEVLATASYQEFLSNAEAATAETTS